jgi:BirA family biotin operon repressor/biotin-[acetyl-CoA-carboxylase] ligase
VSVSKAGGALGTPRLHLRVIDSTNTRARELAAAGAPHGTLVTADEQRAGRGRQGRTWSAPPGRALLSSLVLRDPPRLLPLLAGVAVAEVAEGAGAPAQVKWPNDVLVDGRKVAGILVEGRPQERWAVLGIGLNVALRPEDFPPQLRDTAATLGLEPGAVPATLAALLEALERWLEWPPEVVLDAVRRRDALRGRRITWSAGEGIADGIDGDGRLVIRVGDGSRVALDAGEVHLGG